MLLSSRRFLPSLSLLSAFEAAARTGSVTAAARELQLTQSAVSRQIRLLEEQLGADLFLRERQTIRLTMAGESYVREIREALRRISSASLNLRANPTGGTLNLAILPTFGTRWLAPRLVSFLDANPGVAVNLSTRLQPFDFRQESFDAAIHFGMPHWPGADLTFLMGEEAMPVCSPTFKARHGLESPADLLGAPLLHMTTRPDAWEGWMTANGVAFETLHGMLFDQFSTMAEAAASGLGAALIPTLLIETELRSGALVPAGPALANHGGYYLASSSERADYRPLAAFRQWIVEQAGIVEQVKAGLPPRGK